MHLWNDKEFNKKLFALVIPIALQQFILNAVSASDALMLGLLGQDDLSAVSLAGQVQFVFSLFLAAITIGSNIFIAQYWGKGDRDTVEKYFGYALKLAIPVSFLFTLCTALFPASVMRLFTPETALIGKGAEYLRTVSLSYLLCGISQIVVCIMKNCGLAKKSTQITLICAVLDMGMNAVLILGLLGCPKLGIVGAAISTVAVRLLELIWTGAVLKKSDTVRFRLSYFLHMQKELVKAFWSKTTPVLGNELVWGVGYTMGTVIMGHLGSDAAAAHSVANITKNLVVCLCIGLGSGGGIIIGNELGAGRLERAKEYGGKLCRLSILFGALSGVVILLISPLILRFSTLSEQASDYLGWMLVVCSYYMIGKAVNSTTIAGIFCAGGDSGFGFLCDTIVMWGIIVPLGLLSAFVFELPVPAVYFFICLDEMLKLPAVYKHYMKYNWVKDLTVKE
ncbi:MAG: MATE family efflux transporter [Clostridia bacterium]|nr:MATE family efflux transporter [Clostridia bacterium]